MAITWPETLPAPLRTGLKITPNPDVRARDTQSGRLELLRFGAGNPDTLTCTLRLRGDQVARFELFYARDLNMGRNWIDADWLASALGYTDHFLRIVGYVPRQDESPRSDYALTCSIARRADCPADTTWPETV